MKTICVDFDRVIHQYTTLWSGPANIEDPPVKGAFEWLTEMSGYYEVCIYSARSSTDEGRQAMVQWFLLRGLPVEVLAKFHFPIRKPSAVLYIDDRAFHFQGNFPTKEFIDNFKPWHPEKPDVDRTVSIAAALWEDGKVSDVAFFSKIINSVGPEKRAVLVCLLADAYKDTQ